MLKTILQFCLTPSNFLICLLALGLCLLLSRWRQQGTTFIALGTGGMLLFGYTSAGELIMAPLVTRFPPGDISEAPAPLGIIVMAGGINEIHAAHTGALMELEPGGERVPIAALLARRFSDAELIVSGASGHAAPLRMVDGMQRILMEFGIAEDRIKLDAESRNTYERAQNVRRLIGDNADKTWWVVTSAHKMPRAIGAFRKIGFEPFPYPVDFRWIPPFDPLYTYQLPAGLQMTDEAAHEWLGLLFYRVTGRTDALFPAP